MTQQPTFSDGTPHTPPTRHPFIVFEGVDGVGKTTISQRIAEHYNVFIGCTSHAWWSNEPYCYVHRNAIKEILTDGNFPNSGYERALIYAADRAYHCELLREELKSRMCITDRYYFSNLVYQSVLDGVPLPWLYTIQPPNLIKPDLIFFCTGDIPTLLERCRSKGETQLTAQQLNDLQEKYHDVLKCEKRIIIDTTEYSVDECVAKCITEIERLQ
jgi:dTMP kinase